MRWPSPGGETRRSSATSSPLSFMEPLHRDGEAHKGEEPGDGKRLSAWCPTPPNCSSWATRCPTWTPPAPRWACAPSPGKRSPRLHHPGGGDQSLQAHPGISWTSCRVPGEFPQCPRGPGGGGQPLPGGGGGHQPPGAGPSQELLESCNRVAVIDHHRRAATYIEGAALNYHEPYASSACELVTELLQYLLEPADLLKTEAEACWPGWYWTPSSLPCVPAAAPLRPPPFSAARVRTPATSRSCSRTTWRHHRQVRHYSERQNVP